MERGKWFENWTPKYIIGKGVIGGKETFSCVGLSGNGDREGGELSSEAGLREKGKRRRSNRGGSNFLTLG